MSLPRADSVLLWTLRLIAACAAAIVLLVVVFLVTEALPALRHISLDRFFSDPSWSPSSERFNMWPMVVASVLITLLAIVFAVPLGIGSAIFCRFYAPKPIAVGYRRLLELLAGIPSVVYGFWGLVVLVPIISHSMLAGSIILALMILPTAALISDASLANVPTDYIRSSAALGLTRWTMICRVLMPAARKGLFTAAILSTARAIGETMAVLMVCGNVVRLPESVMDPVRTLTANIALEMSYAADLHRSVLFVSGLMLMVVVGLLIVLSECVSRGRSNG